MRISLKRAARILDKGGPMPAMRTSDEVIEYRSTNKNLNVEHTKKDIVMLVVEGSERCC